MALSSHILAKLVGTAGQLGLYKGAEEGWKGQY